MMTENLKNVMTTVDVMKDTNKTLRKQYGKVDIDKIERMQDEMQDLMEVGNDIQESMSRSYDVPEDVDEAELDAELEALGEEAEMEGGLGWHRGRGRCRGFCRMRCRVLLMSRRRVGRLRRRLDEEQGFKSPLQGIDWRFRGYGSRDMHKVLALW